MEIILGLAIFVIGAITIVHIIMASRERMLLTKLIKAKDVSEFEVMMASEKPEEEEEENSDLVELENMPDLRVKE